MDLKKSGTLLPFFPPYGWRSDQLEPKGCIRQGDRRSLDDLITLSIIYPANPHYNSQIGRSFNILHYRMSLSKSPTTPFEEHVNPQPSAFV